MPFGVPVPHDSDGSGVALPVHVVPLDGAVQLTDGSALQTDVVVETVLQQKLSAPLAPAVPWPHASVALVRVGVSPPVQVYPADGLGQLTEPSSPHDGVVVPGPGAPV